VAEAAACAQARRRPGQGRTGGRESEGIVREYWVICVDDDEQFLASLGRALPGRVSALCPDFECVFDFVNSAQELFDMLSAAPSTGPAPAMVISDQVMPGTSGIHLIEKLKVPYPDLVCVLLTGHAGLESAKYAINHRLLDQYVSKPIEDLEAFSALVANLLKRHHLNLEERRRSRQLAETVGQLRLSNERIRAMHAAAEQVAMLSKGLRSLDFDEVVTLVTQEVPRIFQAQWGVVCFPEGGCPADVGLQVHRRDCPCPEEDLAGREDARQACRKMEVITDGLPPACARLGGEAPSVIVPLALDRIAQEEPRGKPQEHAYVCLCRLEPAPQHCPELLRYKGRLVQEVLSANLSNARLYQQARRNSQVDLLTGTLTRRALEEKLDVEHERAVRYARPFCIGIIDVDHFKNINDRFGHAVGDRALHDLAEMMLRQARKTDLVARYGGDEFVLLMPETDLEAARQALERMRTRAMEILTPPGQPLTVSGGVAEWSAMPAESAPEVLRRADAALYQAKRSGRNRLAIGSVAREAG
jgi:diguanylate cyclase (GGDEF)-like protein